MEKVLEMRQIYKEFPGVVAVDHVDLILHRGEVLALMGENGAGKSTLIKMLSGMYSPDGGEILLNGRTYHSFTAKQALEAGIAVIYQELNYLNDLSIAENILLGQTRIKKPLHVVNYKKMYEDAEAIMQMVGLGHRKPTDMTSILSVAEKQLIEIARAVSRKCKVLVMDEPTSALNETETEKLFQLINKIKQSGVGVIYISHRMEEIFKIADRVEIMRDGRYITDKPINEMSMDSIVANMVGRELKELYPKRECAVGDTVLKVSGLITGYLKNVEFYVKSGEVVGFFGLMGSGRSEVARCMMGIQPCKTFEMELNGTPIVNKTPDDALRHKMAYVPSERKTEGVDLIMSVKENITLSDLQGIKKGHLLDLKKENSIADRWIDRLKIKTPSRETYADNLSGGNQQKIVIAKCLNIDPVFLVLNEPTKGIDVGAKAEIYDLINKMCEEKHAVMMISSELPEIMAMSDRIYVMCEGRITGVVDKQDFSQERLMKLAIGGV